MPESINTQSRLQVQTEIKSKSSVKNYDRESREDRWQEPNPIPSPSRVKQLRPMVLLVGGIEFFVGLILLILILVYSKQYDLLFGVTHSKLISVSSFGGLLCLAGGGMMLVISVLSDIRRMMWCYVLTSTTLCIYIFTLSVMKIHFALLMLERNPLKLMLGEKHFYLNAPCGIGILTLLGSVIHFVGNVLVFTYYNLKYVRPLLFNVPPE